MLHGMLKCTSTTNENKKNCIKYYKGNKENVLRFKYVLVASICCNMDSSYASLLICRTNIKARKNKRVYLCVLRINWTQTIRSKLKQNYLFSKIE